MKLVGCIRKSKSACQPRSFSPRRKSERSMFLNAVDHVSTSGHSLMRLRSIFLRLSLITLILGSPVREAKSFQHSTISSSVTGGSSSDDLLDVVFNWCVYDVLGASPAPLVCISCTSVVLLLHPCISCTPTFNQYLQPRPLDCSWISNPISHRVLIADWTALRLRDDLPHRRSIDGQHKPSSLAQSANANRTSF